MQTPEIPFTELKTERLLLRPLGPDFALDVARYLRRNRDFFREAGPSVEAEFFTPSFQNIRLKWVEAARVRGESIRFFMLNPESEELEIVGDISISQVKQVPFANGILGYKIDGAWRKQGLMREGLEAVIDFAFRKMRLERLEANIIPKNYASVGLAYRLGFRLEGRSRDYLEINRERRDHLRFALLKTDWQAGLPNPFAEGLNPWLPDLESGLHLRFFTALEDAVLVSAPEGLLQPGPDLAPDVNHALHTTRSMLARKPRKGLIWDFRRLTFFQAGEVHALLEIGEELPVAVVYSEASLGGLAGLLGKGSEDFPENYFEEMTEALEWMKEKVS